jgi:hypothetical protein
VLRNDDDRLALLSVIIIVRSIGIIFYCEFDGSSIVESNIFSIGFGMISILGNSLIERKDYIEAV